ncbi:FkbM family methyltransferase [Stenotrophomonas oahuensis]|uniref:FkbM family methyltransferase n=1 Tax=Stenotrophomonas oahuensis TaxID=3003271 RepID=A0ABY9YIX9_9GAMM|nr:FkbM family methyltransferase [Stenotrophomonas sp. A5586]WNH50781.1 FkbM family methyltransferase [Stenotrophomonas sp. A5586]
MSTLISYAQNFEDIILWRALSRVEGGRYLDIGAQSPDVDSVSRLFYEHGWRGTHVEPTPQYADLLRQRRPEELVLQMAVGETTGILRFFEIVGTGLSTGDESIAEEHRTSGFKVNELRVPLVTLDTVLEQVGPGPVHWLKIDVEGAEKQVVDGWVHSETRPWVLVIESTRPLTAEQTHHQWEPAVLAKGYTFAYFDGLNRFYVSNAHPELLSALAIPPNVFDEFSLSSSSMFCAQVNVAYQQLEQHGQREVAEVRAQEGILREGLESQVLAAHAEREQLEARFKLAEEEAKRIEAEHAGVIKGMVQAHRQAISDFQHVVSVEALSLRAELSTKTEEAEAGRQAAHRWWLAHEALLRDLQQIQSSRSWQITRPLRALRRRLPSAALARTKRALRPLAVRVLRTVLATPGLKRVLKPLISRVPFLYKRLHALAAHEALFDKAQSNRAALQGREHDRTTLHMDKRAREVFADLKRARKEGGVA